MGRDESLNFWAPYNAHQAGRAPRPHCLRLLDYAGPGQGRTALDIGCGEGTETLALLRAGWSVIAIDSDSEALGRLADRTPLADGDRLHLVSADIEDGLDVPTAALIYSGYSLPWVGPESFERTWGALRDALEPGGWLGVNLFGDRDSWAGHLRGTFIPEDETRQLLGGLTVTEFTVRDEEGPAFGGPKHWHVFDVIAQRPAA